MKTHPYNALLPIFHSRVRQFDFFSKIRSYLIMCGIYIRKKFGINKWNRNHLFVFIKIKKNARTRQRGEFFWHFEILWKFRFSSLSDSFVCFCFVDKSDNETTYIYHWI